MADLSPISVARFWSKVDVGKVDECWPWRGAVAGTYGVIKIGGVLHTAHRLAWELFNGEDMGGRFACHHCDTRLCVNPRHVYAGDRKTNTDDMVQRGRSLHGVRNHHAVLNEEEAKRIIRRIMAGEGNTSIARDFGIGHSMVSKIRTGHSWRRLAASIGLHNDPG